MHIYNIIVATILSLLVIVGWNVMFEPTSVQKKIISNKAIKKEYKTVKDALNGPKIKINTENFEGSIALRGLIIESIFLKKYSAEDSEKHVELLIPNGAKNSYFLDFGWVSDEDIKLPKQNTIWQADGDVLTAEKSITFSYDNEEGIIFKVVLSIDDQYMFRVEKILENHSASSVNIGNYTTINRNFAELYKSQLITHEGPTGVIKDRILEISYKDIIKNDKKFNVEEFKDTRKWFGFSDKYWLVAVILPKLEEEKLYIKHKLDENNDNSFKIINAVHFQAVKPGDSTKIESHFFAGPKDVDVLDYYRKRLNVALFDQAVDFGVLYFITKPIFLLLQTFYGMVGNFGIAIILLTLFIRVLLLPLSLKSCVSMIKMKDIQPQVLRLRELYKDDKVKLNKESMLLFKKNNVHPMSGCLPTLAQIPVFFALYKVLFITIEMRQASFFGWIKDLSIPDPTNIFTLFGLLNWSPPALLSIGVLPIILGVTMIIQQNLTQATYTDKTQAIMIKLMPYIFIVLFASFPAGLVVYWIFNNMISISQQVLVKKYLIYKSNKMIKRANI